MEEFKKILFITSCCFSDHQSNGKTLEEFFSFYPKEKLFQFFVKSFQPDWSFCDHYFRVTDKDALLCLFSRHGGLMSKPASTSEKKVNTYRKVKKDAFRLLLRQAVWKTGFWARRTGFYKWVDSIAPNVLFFMVGENPFMMEIAVKTAKRRGIPIVLLNTEGYFFSNKDYFPESSLIGKLAFPLYRRYFKRSFRSFMQHVSHVFYSCDKLQKDYGAFFKQPSSVLYTTSHLELPQVGQVKDETGEVVLSYIGSLSNGRYKPLMEIGEVLSRHNLFLNVFGYFDSFVEQALTKAPGIKYHGQIPYTQVVHEIEKSDILIHAENPEPIYFEKIKYGFSTKIADSLMSGKCFFLYAPEYVACYDYIKGINPECAASSYPEMREKLKQLVNHPEKREVYVSRFLKVAKDNHSPSVNQEKIMSVLNQF